MRAIASLAAVAVAARFFGASIERDAWLIAFTAQAVFLQLAFGPVNEIFRAKFVHVAEAHSFEHAFAQLAEWVTVTVIACVAGAGLAWLWSAPLGHALAPGFAPEQVRLVGSMIALGLPVVAFQQIANLWTSALNASGRYYLPDVASIGSSLVQILLVVACAPAFGIYSLFVALYAASLVLCVVLWWSVRRERGFVLAKHPSWPTLRVYSGLSSAFVLPTALAQISALVERALCSLVGPGTVSVLDYARRFVDFPQGVVLGVTQTVVTPQLARHGARDEADIAARRFRHYAGFIAALVLPAAIVLALFAPAIVHLVLTRGAFTPADERVTASVLRILAIGLTGAAFHSVAGQAMVARGESTRYAWVSATIQALILATNLLFYRRFGVLTFALSWTAFHLVSGAILLALAMRPRRT